MEQQKENNILEKELDYMVELKNAAEQFISNSESLTLKNIEEFINYREGKIDILKKLENKREYLSNKECSRPVNKEMKRLVQEIISMNKKIEEIMQNQKLEITKEMTKVADIYRGEKSRFYLHGRKEIVNILRR